MKTAGLKELITAIDDELVPSDRIQDSFAAGMYHLMAKAVLSSDSSLKNGQAWTTKPCVDDL